MAVYGLTRFSSAISVRGGAGRLIFEPVDVGGEMLDVQPFDLPEMTFEPLPHEFGEQLLRNPHYH